MPGNLARSQGALNQVRNQYRNNARKSGREFKILPKLFAELTSSPCHYCGIEPSRIHRSVWNSGDYAYNGLDRVDNSKGYIPENVVPCCYTCNSAKSKMTKSEFLAWVQRVYNYSFERSK